MNVIACFMNLQAASIKGERKSGMILEGSPSVIKSNSVRGAAK